MILGFLESCVLRHLVKKLRMLPKDTLQPAVKEWEGDSEQTNSKWLNAKLANTCVGG